MWAEDFLRLRFTFLPGCMLILGFLSGAFTMGALGCILRIDSPKLESCLRAARRNLRMRRGER